MAAPPGADLVDPRIPRVEQGVVALGLLVGFVFRFDWLGPLLALVLVLDAALGPRGPVPVAFEALAAPRLGRPARLVPVLPHRLTALVQAVALVVAWLLRDSGLAALGTLLVLAVAVAAALTAVAQICLGCRVFTRVARGR